MAIVLHILVEVWKVLLMMAPYLLFGFTVAGVLSLFLTRAWVAHHLGGRGVWQVVKAALFGVPLPLCSCGVLPLAFSLRQEGASKGATVSFLAATPQTGVDSIMLTWSLLGPILAVVRVISAFLSGVLAGIFTELADKPSAAGCGCAVNQAAAGAVGGCCGSVGGAPVPESKSALRVKLFSMEALRKFARHAFITLPRGMAPRLLFGVLLSGLVSAFVPEGFFARHLNASLISYLIALTVGIPMYVCSAASVPLAATFIHMGASPGAAMVFLIAGPGVNAAGVSAMWRQIGAGGAVSLLGAIGVVALSAGTLLDHYGASVRESIPVVQAAACAHGEHGATSLWAFIATVVMVAILLPGLKPLLPGKGRRAGHGE